MVLLNTVILSFSQPANYQYKGVLYSQLHPHVANNSWEVQLNTLLSLGVHRKRSEGCISCDCVGRRFVGRPEGPD